MITNIAKAEMTLFESVGYTATGQVIRRELNRDLVPWQDTDEVHADLAGYMSQYNMTIFKLDLEHCIGQRFQYLAFNFNNILF